MASVMGGVPASNLSGSGGGREAVEADVGDHVAAAQERRHGLQQLLAAPQHADPGRPAQLVGREGHEVGAHGLHVGRVVGDELAGVDDGQRAGGVGGVGQEARPG